VLQDQLVAVADDAPDAGLRSSWLSAHVGWMAMMCCCCVVGAATLFVRRRGSLKADAQVRDIESFFLAAEEFGSDCDEEVPLLPLLACE